MTFTFMIGAIIGSSLAIAVGGPPLRKLMAVIEERVRPCATNARQNPRPSAGFPG